MNPFLNQIRRYPMQWVNECDPREKPAKADYECQACGYVEGIGADDARCQLHRFSVNFFGKGEEPELVCVDCGSKNVTGYLAP